MAARLDWGRSVVRVSAWAIPFAALCLPAAPRTLAASPTDPRATVAAAQIKQAKTFWWQTPKAPVVGANATTTEAWFDANWGAPWPLDNVPKGEGRAVIGSGMPACPFSQSKIPLYPAEIVLEATFTNWTVFLTPSHRSIYTQVEYKIDHVLVAPKGWLRAGQFVDVLYPGGTVRLSDGQIIHWWLPSTQRQLRTYPRPGRQYVLFLQYVFPLAQGYWEEASIEVRGKKVVGGFHGWYRGRIPRGMPLQEFFDLIKNSTREYETTH